MTENISAEKLAKLQLIRSQNVGPITYYRLLEQFVTATRALDALPDLARRGGARAPKIAKREDIEREVETLDALGAKLIAHDENAYPVLLRQIEDAPPVISVLGHPHLLNKRAVAIAGARNASLNGQRFTEHLSRELGANGLLVVSGMARGIDTAAHTGALESGTVAVVAGGVDVVYPPENQTLYERIIAQGAVISEMPPGETPQARHFPRRNRIISGMARGVVIVEAAPRSGSLITARMALEQNREVFAVPGAPDDPRARGPNGLIRQGAILVENVQDILSPLNEMQNTPLSDREPVDYKRENCTPPSESDVAEARDLLINLLSPTPVSVDELVRNGQFSLPVTSLVLLELELAGRLERHPGNRVALLRADE